MTTAITAIGTANPGYMRFQKDAADIVSAGLNLSAVENRLLRSVYKATGIEKRYSVLSDYCKKPGEFEFFPNHPDADFPSTAARMKLYKENALTLALAAIENCFGLNATLADVSHLITVSCTGMYAPGIDIEIIQHLSLNSSINRTAVNFMGCYGAFNAIKLADAICKSDHAAKVLVVCVELCTIHFQKNKSLQSLVSNAIFADGAAAALIEYTNQDKKHMSLEAFHCDLIPQTSNEMAWHIADFGFDIVLSSYVPQVIETGIAQFTQKLLQKNNYNLNDIDLYAIHPGGVKILEACEEALKITPAHNHHSYATLQDYGNMSSATVLFVLKRIWDSLTSADHQKNIFSCAFGPGLTLESMLLKTHCVS